MKPRRGLLVLGVELSLSLDLLVMVVKLAGQTDGWTVAVCRLAG